MQDEVAVSATVVELRRRRDDSVVAQTETDAKGRFDFFNLKPGEILNTSLCVSVCALCVVVDGRG